MQQRSFLRGPLWRPVQHSHVACSILVRGAASSSSLFGAPSAGGRRLGRVRDPRAIPHFVKQVLLVQLPVALLVLVLNKDLECTLCSKALISSKYGPLWSSVEAKTFFAQTLHPSQISVCDLLMLCYIHSVPRSNWNSNSNLHHKK